MNLETPGKRERRHSILKGVYEDNLRIKTNQTVPKRRRTDDGQEPKRSLWLTRAVLAMAVMLIMLGGFQVYQEIQAQQRQENQATLVSANASLSPAERMAEEFGSPEDLVLVEKDFYNIKREVPLANLYGLEVKTIVIDAGHGGKDPGAVGPTGLVEKDVTLDVARRLQRRLERQGFLVLLTRTDDTKMSLRKRIEFANNQNADLFISVHVNAFESESINSVETYYYSPRSSSQRTLRLVERENEDSGYTFAEFKDIAGKMVNTMKFQESKQLATSIQKILYRNMSQDNDAIRDWGVKSGPFMVLLGVRSPAVLAEISVISNKAEESKLYVPEHREQIAMSLEAGVVEYLNPSPETTTSEPTE